MYNGKDMLAEENGFHFSSARLVVNNQIFAPEHHLNSIDNFAEAASRTTPLRKTSQGEMRSPSMLQHDKQLNDKLNFFDA